MDFPANQIKCTISCRRVSVNKKNECFFFLFILKINYRMYSFLNLQMALYPSYGNDFSSLSICPFFLSLLFQFYRVLTIHCECICHLSFYCFVVQCLNIDIELNFPRMHYIHICVFRCTVLFNRNKNVCH